MDLVEILVSPIKKGWVVSINPINKKLSKCLVSYSKYIQTNAELVKQSSTTNSHDTEQYTQQY